MHAWWDGRGVSERRERVEGRGRRERLTIHRLDVLGLLAQPFGMGGGRIEERRRLEELELSICRRRSRLLEEPPNVGIAHRSERARRVEGLLEDLHAVAAGDYHRRRQVHCIVKTLRGRDRLRLEDDPV